MRHFFVDLARSRQPGLDDLELFVSETEALLRFLVEGKDFGQPLWRGDDYLRQLAADSLSADIIPAAQELKNAIRSIPETELKRHGLTGTAARFKYNAIAKLSRNWRRYRGKYTVGGTFRSLMQGVEAVLDSLISAAGGTGGLLKEFKEVIMALAPTR